MADTIELWLDKLIGSELIAYAQYELASHVVIGTDYDACAAEFKQHADEEREHMNILLASAIERDYRVNTELKSLISLADPAYQIMSGTSSKDLVLFHIKAEEEAIKTYKEFYDIIKDSDITLARKTKKILEEEIEHRTDLRKIMSSISPESLTTDTSVYTYFTNLAERLKQL